MTINREINKILFTGIALFTLLPFIKAPLALVIGVLYSLLFGNPFPQFISKLSRYLLQASIIGLGFGLNAVKAFEVSKDGFFITLATILLVFLLGWLFNKILKIDKITALLISAGTAICGGSAIASVAPVVKAQSNQISIAIGTVFILNSIALISFPVIGRFLELSEYQFGLWAAIAIHDTSSVVGAAQAFGGEALEIATTVKLTRALWIIPVTLVIAYFYHKTSKVKFPIFILGFVAAIIITTLLPQMDFIYGTITSVARQILVTTLFLIGSNISLTQIKKVGTRSMSYATLLWVLVSIFSLIVILNNF